MLPVLTPEESAALDRTAAARGIPVDDLMEHAGRAVADAVARVCGGAYGRRATVVCGKGNNGGDGLVAARLLAARGMAATVLLLADPGDLRGAAAGALDRLLAADGRLRRCTPESLRRELGRADVAVDAIFGTGFRGKPEGAHASAIAALNAFGGPVVAVDVPSGVDGATGAADGPAVAATLTVTLGTLKPGTLFQPGAGLAGAVEIGDIGIPAELVRATAHVLEPDDVAALLPRRPPGAHKRSAGVVVVIAGSRGMTGAAVLVAGAAYRAGAGLVSVAAPGGIVPVLQGRLVEATFLPLPETAAGTIDEAALEPLRGRLEAADAVAIGPGLGRDPATDAFVHGVVAASPVPLVVDADALNAFAGRAEALRGRASAAVLTPHAGEFARLTGASAGEIEADRIGRARALATAVGCVVLLKGPGTVVAEPAGGVRVNPTGGPALATGGTGDVLTGTIAALLARGAAPVDAASAGAFLHGLAGDLAGAELGDGVVAPDVAERLPRAAALVGGGAGR